MLGKPLRFLAIIKAAKRCQSWRLSVGGGSLRRTLLIASVAMLLPLSSAWAQLEVPNEAGVTFGHVHTIVRDVEATKKFWTTLGGQAIKIDKTDVM